MVEQSKGDSGFIELMTLPIKLCQGLCLRHWFPQVPSQHSLPVRLLIYWFPDTSCWRVSSIFATLTKATEATKQHMINAFLKCFFLIDGQNTLYTCSMEAILSVFLDIKCSSLEPNKIDRHSYIAHSLKVLLRLVDNLLNQFIDQSLGPFHYLKCRH